MIQQTLVLIKPDGIKKSLTGNILTRLSETKLDIVAAKIVKVSRELAANHYVYMKDKPFYEELLKYIMGEYHILQKLKLQDFLAALQASPNGVVLLDAQGRIEWFNQIAGAHFGFDVRRDLLQHFGNLVRDPEFAAYFSDRDFSRDVVMPGRDSTSAKPVRLSVQLHPYCEGRSLLLSRDITAVEQAEAMRRDFVANVSHEIRTPLTVLAGFVE